MLRTPLKPCQQRGCPSQGKTSRTPCDQEGCPNEGYHCHLMSQNFACNRFGQHGCPCGSVPRAWRNRRRVIRVGPGNTGRSPPAASPAPPTSWQNRGRVTDISRGCWRSFRGQGDRPAPGLVGRTLGPSLGFPGQHCREMANARGLPTSLAGAVPQKDQKSKKEHA